jgi:hypothetical protein
MGAASTLFHYIDVTIGWMITFVGIILCPSVAGKAACGLNQCRSSLTMSAKSTGGNSVLVKDEQKCRSEEMQLLVYDALVLCKPGKAHELVDRKDNTYGCKYVINPSGGLESKG